MPIPHAALVESVENNLFEEGFMVSRSEFATLAGGDILFGVMDLLSGPAKEIAPSIGIRSSNNKRFSIQLIVGTRVFVCDNLAFSGEVIALKRRHTSGLELDLEVKEGVKRFGEKFKEFQAGIQVQKELKLEDDAAKAIFYDVFKDRALPLKLLPTVHEAYWGEQSPFETGNLWSVNNALTEAAKKLNNAPRFRSLIQIGTIISREAAKAHRSNEALG